jgi:hypothetical protein
VFEVKDRTLRTTSAFGEWFDNLVACCPPINETFTALFLVNTNVEREAIEGIVPEEPLARLDQFVVNNGMVYNETIQTAGRKLLSLRGAYDRLLPVEIDVNPLPPLEALFYQTWVNSTTADSELSRWVRQAAETNPDPLEPGEQSQFGVAALNAPLRIEYDRPIFTTLDHKKDRSSYYENSKSKLAEIKRILRTSDYLGDD